MSIPTDHNQPRVGLFYYTRPRGEGGCSALAIRRMLSTGKKADRWMLTAKESLSFLFFFSSFLSTKDDPPDAQWKGKRGEDMIRRMLIADVNREKREIMRLRDSPDA